MSDVELIREALELLETQEEDAMYLAFVAGDPAGDALAALARVEATLNEVQKVMRRAEAAEARVVALTAAIEEERRWVTGTAEHNDARTELYRLAALARTASTTGASGALRDPDPGLGAGSVIDSQPSADARRTTPRGGDVSVTIDCGEGKHDLCVGYASHTYLFPQYDGERFDCGCPCHEKAASPALAEPPERTT